MLGWWEGCVKVVVGGRWLGVGIRWKYKPTSSAGFSIPLPISLSLTIPDNVDTILQRLKENIDKLAVVELMLPSTEIEMILQCFNPECQGSLRVQNSKILFNIRKRPCVGSTELEALTCDSCSTNCSISSRINAALDHGYQRCYGRSKLSKHEIIDLVWTYILTYQTC